jgi:hypothetical protein
MVLEEPVTLISVDNLTQIFNQKFTIEVRDLCTGIDCVKASYRCSRVGKSKTWVDKRKPPQAFGHILYMLHNKGRHMSANHEYQICCHLAILCLAAVVISFRKGKY